MIGRLVFGFLFFDWNDGWQFLFSESPARRLSRRDRAA